MKILFFCNLAPRKTGSFEALLVALAQECVGADDEIVYVFAEEPIDAVAEPLRATRARWHALDGWAGEGRVNPWRFVCPALRLLREERPDVAVVHFGNELPSLVAATIGKFLGLKTHWVWQQDQQIQDPGRLSSRLSKLRILTLAFRQFVAVYEGGKRSMILRGIPDGRISVIYNSAPDWERRRESGWLREELGIPADVCLCVTVSSLIPRKRVDWVLRAFAEVVNGYSLTVNRGEQAKHEASEDVKNKEEVQGPRSMVHSLPCLLLIGDGPERAKLEKLAEECGVADRVHFLGLRNDVREILLEADLLVHAATAEACSYALIESMASGIPAVVTESGAAREQIVDGETGFVVGRDNLAGFTVRFRELMGDAGKRKTMGAGARQRWQERYRVETAAAKYHALYRSLV